MSDRAEKHPLAAAVDALGLPELEDIVPFPADVAKMIGIPTPGDVAKELKNKVSGQVSSRKLRL